MAIALARVRVPLAGLSGVYALLAHLRRRSVRVEAGQRVVRGERVAELGNSGSSSEPHVHFQLMDHPSPMLAAGLPMAFDSFDVDGETRSGVPGSAQPFMTR